MAFISAALTYVQCLRTQVEGVKFTLELSRTNAMQSINAQVITPSIPSCSQYAAWSDNWIRCAISYSTTSIFHFAGSCKMGNSSDSMAVVNPKLEVYGIHGLRVIDASIIPALPSGNINAPTIMIGEKGADMIMRKYCMVSTCNW